MKQMHQIFIGLLSVVAILLCAESARSEVRFGGFADVAFYATDESDLDSSSGFKLGQFVLHLNSRLSDRISAFAELTWTPRDDGYSTEVERVMLKYEHSDALKPSAGRYHTPVSWWNVAFHHGAWLQTTVDRPIAVKFGSKLIPIHLVGAMLEGRVFPAGFSVSYTGALGNGRGSNIGRGGDTGDVNNHTASLVQLGLRHDALYDLQIGGAIYLDRFASGTPTSEFDEQILSAYLVYSSEKARNPRSSQSSFTSVMRSAAREWLRPTRVTMCRRPTVFPSPTSYSSRTRGLKTSTWMPRTSPSPEWSPIWIGFWSGFAQT
jgi:hypothetical protein